MGIVFYVEIVLEKSKYKVDILYCLCARRYSHIPGKSPMKEFTEKLKYLTSNNLNMGSDIDTVLAH